MRKGRGVLLPSWRIFALSNKALINKGAGRMSISLPGCSLLFSAALRGTEAGGAGTAPGCPQGPSGPPWARHSRAQIAV